MKKSKSQRRYFIHVPGWVYAISFDAASERAAREAARAWLGVTRLPRGTAVWAA